MITDTPANVAYLTEQLEAMARHNGQQAARISELTCQLMTARAEALRHYRAWQALQEDAEPEPTEFPTGLTEQTNTLLDKAMYALLGLASGLLYALVVMPRLEAWLGR